MAGDNRLTAPRLPMRDEDVHSAIVRLRGLSAPIEECIFGTAGILYEFFHANGYEVRRNEVITPALAKHRGWIYAFYDEHDVALYIGETKRAFSTRFNEHCDKSWWPDWDRVKVLPCPDAALRKVFESIVGLGGGYLANKSQPLIGENAFDDLVFCLLKLGNDECNLPRFPNDMIRNQTCSLATLLGMEVDDPL